MSLPDHEFVAQDGTPPSDGSLLRRYRRGEEDAATRLYLRYANRLEELARHQTSDSLAAKFDPEDVVQSVFRTFFRRVADGQYDLPPGDELWRLLLVIALNKIRGLGIHHRAAKRDVGRTAHVERLDLCAPSREPEAAALSTLQMVIDELLADAPESNRRMIELRIQGHEVADIARLTERSQRSVERVLQSFRARLGRLIEAE